MRAALAKDAVSAVLRASEPIAPASRRPACNDCNRNSSIPLLHCSEWQAAGDDTNEQQQTRRRRRKKPRPRRPPSPADADTDTDNEGQDNPLASQLVQRDEWLHQMLGTGGDNAPGGALDPMFPGSLAGKPGAGFGVGDTWLRQRRQPGSDSGRSAS